MLASSPYAANLQRPHYCGRTVVSFRLVGVTGRWGAIQSNPDGDSESFRVETAQRFEREPECQISFISGIVHLRDRETASVYAI